jgi:hypothetical protein
MGPHNVRQSARNRCEKQADAPIARAFAIGNAVLAGIFVAIEKRQAGPGEPRPLHFGALVPPQRSVTRDLSRTRVRIVEALVKFNHLDLQTTDVQALAGFFVEHFDLERRSNDRSPAIAILGDEAGFTLVIQRTDVAAYPAGFHVGFILDRASDVRAHHARLVAAGVAVGSIDVNARGTRFYLTAPGSIVVETSSPDRGK